MWFKSIISDSWKISITIGGIAVGLAGLAAAYKKLYNNENRDANTILSQYEKLLKELEVVENLDSIYNKQNDVLNLPSKIVIEKYIESCGINLYNYELTLSLMKSEVNTRLERAIKCLRDKNYEDVEEACKEELARKNSKNKKRKLTRKIRRALALNLLGTFAILRGDYATAVEHLTTVIETPNALQELVINSLLKRSSIFL